MEEENKNPKGPKLNIIFILVIALLLTAVAGEYLYFTMQRGSEEKVEIGMKPRNLPEGEKPQGSPEDTRMAMTEVTPPPLSDQQKIQTEDGLSTKTTEKTFNITGGNFYFVPNQITVNKGDTVTLVMTNAGGIHNIFIDEFDVKSSTIKTAEATSVTFVADKSGSFVYYCAIPSHRVKGMWGTLTVK